eukprot:m.102994 g.102994  ORF g.102994 m.102994 type:complete len:235 (-) comp15706_c0_seq3:486-1190(-)
MAAPSLLRCLGRRVSTQLRQTWSSSPSLQSPLSTLLRRQASSSSSTSTSTSSSSSKVDASNASSIYYLGALTVFTVGMSYAAVPLYRMFCQATGFGGTVMKGTDPLKIAAMKPVEDRVIKIKFAANTSTTLPWKFYPVQNEIEVVPGETALAFFTAKNPSDEAITGISTYNVIPYEVGQYFNKIQCFCFEEQRLNANEEVDMPVFFYLDPEFAEDPNLARVEEVTLSYTFFKSK